MSRDLDRLRAALDDPFDRGPRDEGLEAARDLARWHLGSASWADRVLRAYLDPEGTRRRLADERGDPYLPGTL